MIVLTVGGKEYTIGVAEYKDLWLASKILRDQPKWDPLFALQSTVNWVQSLVFEVEREHGPTVREQFSSCQRQFAEMHVGGRSDERDLAETYTHLFHSLTFVTALDSLCSEVVAPWKFPSATVQWYYAVYNSIGAILRAYNGASPESHSATARTLSTSGLRSKLPHPLDMSAVPTGTTYAPGLLPQYPQSSTTKLIAKFELNESDARGKLLSYLNGTGEWVIDRVKKDLRTKHRLSDFRTKHARSLLSQSLRDEVNFLTCAYRYRGKANYRDALFLAYGPPHPWLSPQYLDNLSRSSRFVFICALAYAERRFGAKNTSSFLNDLTAGMRGSASIPADIRFWERLV